MQNEIHYDTHLPIHEVIPRIKESLKSNASLIVQAPPGAGKSTVLPLEILNEPWLEGKKILMLEPRKLAARSVAERMASLLGEKVAETVGYRVRFENKCTDKTRIEILTEGILTRMMQTDNALEGVGMVIFDEFHERSLQGDLAFTLCRQVQEILRPDLRILVMSATIDTEFLSGILGKAPVITSEGKQFPVSIKYFSKEKDRDIATQMAILIRKALNEEEGDVLAFLPGAGEITKCESLLSQNVSSVEILPLYGDLPFSKQQEAIAPNPYGKRKVVLATSIAETSLTIEGIKIVVDSGYSRVPRFDPRSGLTRLETVNVTKDSAEQRTGRAGRLSAGVCYRLWSEGEHLHLQERRKPEILEADLASLVLETLNWGVKDIQKLNWPSPPPPGSVAQAKDLLQKLEAIENDSITEKGKAILKLPTHPRIAHMLLEGKEIKKTSLACDVASLLEERDPLPRDSGADLTLRLEVLKRWRRGDRVNAERNILERIEKLSNAWKKILHAEKENENFLPEEAGILVAAAYPERIAMQRVPQKPNYKLANGRGAKLQDNDPLTQEKWLAVASMDAGLNEGKIFLAAPVEPLQLDFLLHEEETVRWDFQQGMLITGKETKIGDLVVNRIPSKNASPDIIREVIIEAVKTQPQLLSWDEETENLQSRILSLREWRKDLDLPDVSKEALWKDVGSWLSPWIENVKKESDLKKLDLKEIIKSILTWEQNQQLDVLAPGKIKVPSGSMIDIQYKSDGSPPVLAVRLQELFGLLETPSINQGKVPLMIHLLSPAYRPVQVTQSLSSFWENTYAEVRKEMKIRYPKHSWPEDPKTAEPVKGVKRKK